MRARKEIVVCEITRFTVASVARDHLGKFINVMHPEIGIGVETEEKGCKPNASLEGIWMLKLGS